jgi:hypothetical protein
MSHWLDPPARRYDDITISAIRIAFVLSLLVHAAALWTYLPKMQLLSPSEADEKGETGSPLAVKLMPQQLPPGSMPTSPPPPAPQVAPPMTASASPPPTAALRPPSRSQVIAAPSRTPDAPKLPIAPPEAKPAPPRPTDATDMAAYVEARRRARGESTPAASRSSSDSQKSESENDRANRIIAANLGLNARQNFGSDSNHGGGVFAIKTREYDYAEFWFFGWNKDIRRTAKQVIEVRKGDNADIKIAIVRKMIGIVREQYTEDFLWESQRLRKQLTLSARLKDSAELEAFLMQEFFFEELNPR